MSAFLCSDLHTMTVAIAYVRNVDDQADAVSIAQTLRDANNKAMRACYEDEPTPLGGVANLMINSAHIVGPAANSLARSLRYQCAQGDVLKTHPAAALLTRLINATGGEDATIDGPWPI